jgi:hypothetical protein
MDATVLLTGATGYIGGRLLRQFEEGGRATEIRSTFREHPEVMSHVFDDVDLLDRVEIAVLRRPELHAAGHPEQGKGPESIGWTTAHPQ